MTNSDLEDDPKYFFFMKKPIKNFDCVLIWQTKNISIVKRSKSFFFRLKCLGALLNKPDFHEEIKKYFYI